MAFRMSNGLPRKFGSRLALLTPGTVDAATSVTITEFEEGRIFQRVGTSKKLMVPVVYAGTSRSIQARAVMLDGTPVTPWATDSAPSNGTALVQLDVPQGGMYKLQARDGNDTSIHTTGARLFGVGLLLALIGQSNMAMMSTATLDYPLASLICRRYTQSSAAWNFVGNYDPTGKFPPGAASSVYGSNRVNNTPRGDGTVVLVNTLSAALGIPVGILEYAVTGSNITGWQPGSGAQWSTFATAVAGAGGDFEAALWYQGENNASAGTSSAQYQAYLANVLAGCRAITGRDASSLKFGVVTLGPTSGYGSEGSFGTIRAAQLAFARGTSGVFLAGVPTDAAISDNVHLTVPWFVRMAKRYTKSILAQLSGAERPGPRIASATRSGVIITVNIVGGVGTLKDGAGGSGGALLGYRVFEDGAQVPISSTTISGSTVVLTLDEAPAGAVTLDYAMQNAPYGVPAVAAGVLYDSDIVPSDTLGLPLQPQALINVTGG